MLNGKLSSSPGLTYVALHQVELSERAQRKKITFVQFIVLCVTPRVNWCIQTRYYETIYIRGLSKISKKFQDGLRWSVTICLRLGQVKKTVE